MTKKELYKALSCALTHDIVVCEKCQKCPGGNCADIRLNLISELAKRFRYDVPWVEDGDDKHGY